VTLADFQEYPIGIIHYYQTGEKNTTGGNSNLPFGFDIHIFFWRSSCCFSL